MASLPVNQNIRRVLESGTQQNVVVVCPMDGKRRIDLCRRVHLLAGVHRGMLTANLFALCLVAFAVCCRHMANIRIPEVKTQ